MNNEEYSRIKRKLKSLSERILLLDVNYYPIPNFAQCKILSSKNKEYSINIQVKHQNIEKDDENDTLDISCTCMDYQVRKNFCKHIFWFCRNSLNQSTMNPLDCKSSDLYEFVYYYLHVGLSKKKGRNENCPICLEKIYYESENYICCENNCGNAVHNICWSRYKYIGNTSKCVLCRKYIYQ